MQTFLPYADFVQNAKAIDKTRLNSQCNEALLAANTTVRIRSGEKTVGWRNHPTRLMWADHLYALCEYGKACCDEFIARGGHDSRRAKFVAIQQTTEDNGMPAWLGGEALHRSHRSNLLRKAEERLAKTGKRDVLDWYRAMWPDLPSDLPYIWPVRIAQTLRQPKSECIMVS